ncbi:MAG: TRAP transporter TatT component family protein [Deltaproteobacteria bacterium]|nr:TRAP transporter TatT component family protein [Deltaproteobacteria bacterium]
MKLKKFLPAFTALLLVFGLTSCGFKKVATKASAQIFYDASPSIDREDDVELAEQASLGFLKMLEGFYTQNPKDKQVLFLLTKAYAGYAFGFTENDILANKGGNQAAYDLAMARAKRFYTRARDYGLQLLSRNPAFAKAQEGTLDDFNKALKTFGKADMEDMFWAGFAWGNYLNFNKDSTDAVAELPRIEALFNRMIELDDSYYFGGPHLFLGAFYGGRPKMLGGDPEKSKMNFEKAIEISGGKYLMGPVSEAQYYAVQIQDQALFTKLLTGVLAADAAALPEQRLSNELAKRRAKILLDKKSTFFSQSNPDKPKKRK